MDGLVTCLIPTPAGVSELEIPSPRTGLTAKEPCPCHPCRACRPCRPSCHPCRPCRPCRPSLTTDPEHSHCCPCSGSEDGCLGGSAQVWLTYPHSWKHSNHKQLLNGRVLLCNSFLCSSQTQSPYHETSPTCEVCPVGQHRQTSLQHGIRQLKHLRRLSAWLDCTGVTGSECITRATIPQQRDL